MLQDLYHQQYDLFRSGAAVQDVARMLDGELVESFHSVLGWAIMAWWIGAMSAAEPAPAAFASVCSEQACAHSSELLVKPWKLNYLHSI